MNDVFKTSGDGRFRVIITADTDAEEPYDGCASPMIRYDGSHTQHIQAGDRPTDDDSAIEAAAVRWGSPSGGDFKLFKRYLRIFYGVTQIETWYSGSYWYVTYDSISWREYVGSQPGSADMSEYKAWAEGDVYGVYVERLDTWTTSDGRTEDRWTQTGVEDYATWSIYGYEYATERAGEMLAEAIEDSEEVTADA